MKRLLALILSLAMVFSLTACGGSNDNNDAEENTKAPSKTTNDSQNKNDSQDNTQPPSDDSNNLEDYMGTWSEANLSWQDGGFLLDLSCENGIATAYLLLTGSAPYSKLAEIKEVFALSAVKNAKLSADFENDNWGNAGKMTLEFKDEKIICSLSDVAYAGEGSHAMWGMYDCTIELIRNENAHKDLSYTMEDYYELHPESRPSEDTETSTNPSTSIEDMKNSCLMLELYYDDFMSNTNLSPVRFLNNEEQYINKAFVPCQTLTRYIVCPECLGSGFQNGNANNGRKCYNAGYRQKDMTENGIHYILQADPDQATTRPVTIADVLTDVNGSVVYRLHDSLPKMNIYDNRADQSVTLTAGTKFVPYMIYLGSIDNIDQFSMFACDIVE